MKNALMVFVSTLIFFGSAVAQDSLNIVKLSTVPMTAYQVEVRGDYAYIAAYGSGLVVMDISDPTDPREVGQCSLNNPARHVQIEGDLAYVWGGHYHTPNSVSAVDISNPENPVEV